MRIAVCDDERRILEVVSSHIDKYIKQHPDVNLEVSCFETARSLKNALDNGARFDLFLLDVYIEDDIGTELAREIRKRGIDNPIIFLTTSLDHAPESFETGTLRYLIKPLNPEKFYEALDAAIIQVEKLNVKVIKFKTDNGIQTVNAIHILYTESHGHYQHIVLDDGKELRVRMTVSELFNLLAKHDGFTRVGIAYIINLRSIVNVTTHEVKLFNDVTIPIPKGKYSEIKKVFWDFQYEGIEI